MNRTGYGHSIFEIQNNRYIEVIERNGIDKGNSIMTVTAETEIISITTPKQKQSTVCRTMQYQQM